MAHGVPITVSVPERVRATRPLEVLICEPQLRSYGLPYLPAMWGVLKTYWELHADRPEAVRWHEPIHRMDRVDEIMRALSGVRIDVLGLSCYTWNWRLQQAIARAVRAVHPDCLIVAGGPHPDYRDPAFFAENACIDAVVVKDGEIPFTRILSRALSYRSVRELRAEDDPLGDIPGLCLPGSGGSLTAKPEVPADYGVSSYLAQIDYYERFIAEHPQGVVAAWETSRGCPFRCSYCDWGSATMSKVRRFGMDRLSDEIDWFARSGIKVVFSVDSNFGMFKTDVDLTDAIVEAKKTHGEPTYFVYSNAKNVPKRTVEITRKVVAAGLETAHTLSIQHSSERVLAATDRENISIEKQIEVVRALQADGIPISVQLIQGLPEDTPALWRKTFTDLMEWGIHDGYIVTNYHLLPNAPASEPAYRDRWGLRTVTRYIYDGYGERENTPVDPMTFPLGDVVVEAGSFSTDDWIRMSVESACIRALHNGGITQLLARYLRCTRGVSFAEFYNGLLDSVLPASAATADAMRTIEACYSAFITDPESLTLLPLPGVPGARRHAEPHRWMLGEVCRDLGVFFSDLADHVGSRYTDPDGILEDLLVYQQNAIVTPGYDPKVGKTWHSARDWPTYFENPATSIPGSVVAEPRVSPVPVMSACGSGWDDGASTGRFDWVPGDGPESWRSWFLAMATNRLSAAKCTHRIAAQAYSRAAG